MISIKTTLIDSFDFSNVTVTLPCNLADYINPDHEQQIVSCVPEIDWWDSDDIWRINALADEINTANPDMTLEYMDVLFSVSSAKDVFDPEFVRRVCEDEFMFADLSDCDYGLGQRGNAAKYLLKDECVPFDKQVDQFTMNIVVSEELIDYIDWEAIWRRYLTMGFRIIEHDIKYEKKTYLVFW